ncbi:MAG TPA: Holliday junction branch migration protein RuvA [Acidimicrobiales bacterium]|nr:Holliday junction branch migration protein RuvA [Acidimicrobiales bacterium]
MIGSLRGVVIDRDEVGEVLVETGGVGYRVTVPTSTLVSLELGAPAFLHVHTHVRDDAIVLYGFASRDQRRCFEALVGAHGVGPALALAILSAHSPASLQRAVLADDIEALVLVPGVGRKTAARLLIELKARLDVPDLGAEPTASGGNGAGVRAEVRAALTGLGYGPDEVRQVLQSVPAEGATEEVLRAALRELAATP